MSTLVASLLLVLAAPRLQRPTQTLEDSFRQFAAQVQTLGTGDFIYGFRSPSQAVKEFEEFLEASHRPAADFLPLLKHRDPKVRTLALVALYNLKDPRVLPEIFPLASDEAQTFDAIQLTAAPIFVSGARPTQRQTVGEIATKILDTYLESGGYFYGPYGRKESGIPGFDEYWKSHAERASSAGWWKVRLAMTSHATSPTPQDRVQAIRNLRAEIDKVPEPDHTFILLWLNGESGSDALASEQELITFARNLGRETLVQILQRAIPSNDPDLSPRANNNWPYARLCIFLLQNASVLLPPSDSKTLLAQETWERDFQKHGILDPLITPWWAIAAAQLEAANSGSILEAAHMRFNGQFDGTHRLELAEGLWRLNGEPSVKTIVDWIYEELPHPPTMTCGISSTLDRLLKERRRNSRVLAKAVIEDPRFDDMNWKSLEVLAKNMKNWAGQERITPQEIDSVWSPTGIDLFMKDVPQALKSYPKEIGVVVETLARWRQIMRSAASQ